MCDRRHHVGRGAGSEGAERGASQAVQRVGLPVPLEVFEAQEVAALRSHVNAQFAYNSERMGGH